MRVLTGRWLMYLTGFVMVLSAVSCRQTQVTGQPDQSKNVLVSIDGNFLYREDLETVLPFGLSPEDSAAFAQRYIRNWVSELLLFQNAERNIPDTREIDLLVENYRRSLIVHNYEQKLIEQKFGDEITDADVQAFYNDNSRLFVLEDPVIKGLFLKIPASASGISKIRELYTRTDDASFEEIEKYSIRYAVRYEMFYDSWTSISDIESMLPPMDQPLEERLKQKRSLELRDKEFIYLLNVSEIMSRGSVQPLEEVRAEIRGLLLNNSEVEFMQRIKDELYETALSKDRINFIEEK